MLILTIYFQLVICINANKFGYYYLHKVTHHTRETEKHMFYLISCY